MPEVTLHAVTTLEREIAALEGGERAVGFSSGAAAVAAAVLHCIEQDAHVVAMQTVSPQVKSLLGVYLRKFGVDVTYLPTVTVEELEDVCGPDTRLIYLESPSGVVSDMVDLPMVTDFARGRGIISVLDNTWATPLYQNPLRHGVDIVVHSSARYLGGGGTADVGAVIGSAELMERVSSYERATLGSALDEAQATLVLRGLGTLRTRMRVLQESALRVARFLEGHPRIARVFHPGLPSHPQYDIGRRQMSGYPGLVSFVPTWGLSHAREFLSALTGRAESDSPIDLADTGMDEEGSEETGLPLKVFRVSVGLERVQPMIDALDRALRRF